MTLDTAQLAKLVQRYPDMDWKFVDQLNALGKELPEGALATLLWTLHRSGEANLALATTNLWPMLTVKGADFDADDVLDLLTSIQRAWPGGFKKTSWGGSHAWSDQDLPGWFYGMAEVVSGTLADPRRKAALVARWAEVPEPVGHALAYELARQKALPLQTLPDDLLALAAQRFLLHEYIPGWANPVPWPEATWQRAVAHAAAQPGQEIKTSRTFALIAPWLSPEQAAVALENLQIGYDPEWAQRALDALVQHAPRVRPPLQARLIALGAQGPMTTQQAQDREALALGWLALQQAAAETLDPAVEPFLAAWFAAYESRWSGSHYIAFAQLRVRLLRAVVPQTTLERWALARPDFSWQLGPAAATWEVVQRAAHAQKTFSGYAGDAQHHVLLLFGAEATPLLSRLLTQALPCDEVQVLKTLGQLGGADAVPGLVAGLHSTSKLARGAAQSGLLARQTPQDAVLQALPEALACKRKEVREIAASVLPLLPVSRTVWELAQHTLANEKIKAVRETLERVQAPLEAPSAATGGAIVAALAQAHGANWREWSDDPDLLIRSFAQIISKKSQSRGSIEYFGPEELALGQALKALSVQPETLGALVELTEHDSAHMGLFFMEQLQSASGVSMAPQLAELAFSRRLESRAKNAAKGLTQRAVLEWLEKHAPTYREGVLLLALEQETRLRKWATDELRSLDSPRLGAALADLMEREASPMEARVAAAELLGERGELAHLEALERVAGRPGKTKKEQTLQTAAAESLRRLKNAAVDVTRWPADAAGEATLDAALAELAAGVTVEGKAAAALKGAAVRWRLSGAPLSDGALRWLVGTAQRESLEVESAPLKAVRARLEDAECAALCDALQAVAPSREQGWGLYIVGALGGDAHVEALGPELERLASSQRTAWGSDGVEALVRQGSPAAVRWLDHWARRSRRSALLGRAASGLARLAAARGVSVDELIDAATSSFGLDTRGRREVDYGPRAVVFCLKPDGTLVVEDEAGKLHKAPPAARAADDPAKVADAQALFKEIKREIKRILDAQLSRLEDAMTWGRRWEVPVWRARFADHAILRVLSAQLLFEHEGAGEGSAGLLFAVREDGATQTLEGAPLTLPEGGTVRLYHPAGAAEAAQAAAQRWQDRRRARQPFEQVERVCYVEDTWDLADKKTLLRFSATTEARLLKGLDRQRFERGPREDAGLIFTFSRALGPWSVTLKVNGVCPDTYDDVDLRAELTGLSLRRDGDAIPWADAPLRLRSDLIRAAVLAVGLA